MAFSLNIEGATKKVLQIFMLLKSSYILSFNFNEEKYIFEH